MLVCKTNNLLIEFYVNFQQEGLLRSQPNRTSAADYINTYRLLAGAVLYPLSILLAGGLVLVSTESWGWALLVWAASLELIVWSVRIYDVFRKNKKTVSMWLWKDTELVDELARQRQSLQTRLAAWVGNS